MGIFSIILTIIGLAVFEAVSSLDNAIINAQVLTTMSARARKWFLSYGLLISVFIVRGLLPLVIVWVANPSLGPVGALTATFSADPQVQRSIEASSPLLLIGGGMFLLFLFFHWLFLEPKHFGLRGEQFIQSQGIWFYSIVSTLLTGLVWLSLRVHPLMALGAVAGATIFFIVHGFEENAEKAEKGLMQGNITSDLSKLFYLEIIDATFSVDGVLGAFAFTLAVPLILLGNGIGALIVRSVTVRSVTVIKQYKYLKNGAMYSIFFLGCVMVLDSFGVRVPQWVSPIMTISIIGYFFLKSKKTVNVV